MVKDPVCGMSVDEKKAPLRIEHKGQTYHFCSDSCQAKFKAKPDQYAGKSGK